MKKLAKVMKRNRNVQKNIHNGQKIHKHLHLFQQSKTFYIKEQHTPFTAYHISMEF